MDRTKLKKIGKFFIILLLMYIVAFFVGNLIDNGTDLKFEAESFTSGTLFIILIVEIVVYLLFKFKNISKGSKSSGGAIKAGKTKEGDSVYQYYDAHWISEEELETSKRFMFTYFKDLKNKKDGIVIRSYLKGNRLLINMYKPIHTLIIGTTGSGKTTLYIDPSIQILSSTKTKPSLIITDPKGELEKKHKKKLLMEGYDIKVLDLRKPYSSTRWNPMDNAYLAYDRAMNIEKEVKVYKNVNPVDYDLKIIAKQYNAEWYSFNGIAYPNKQALIGDLSAKRQELIDYAENDLREIAQVLCPIESKQDASWEMGARDFIYGVLLAMLEDTQIPELNLTRDKFNFYNLAKIANYKDNDPDDPYQTLRAYFMGRPQTSKALSLASTCINNAPNTIRSYMGIVTNKLNIFQDTGMCYATSKNEIDFSTFVSRPTALIIKVPDEKESRHPIATMCVSQVYKKLVEAANETKELALPRRVYFLLDEFANLPKINNMDSLITVGRSREIYFSLVVQSYSQLATKYGEQVANTIRGNCNIQIYIGSDDQKTKEEFSKSCGEVSIVTENKSSSVSEKNSSGNSVTTSNQTVNRPLVYPYELGQLGKNTVIIKMFGEHPIKTKITPAWQVPMYCMEEIPEEYRPMQSLDENKIYYDIAERNNKILDMGNYDEGNY